MTCHSQHKWWIRSSISVLLRCKHSLMPSRISSNYLSSPQVHTCAHPKGWMEQGRSWQLGGPKWSRHPRFSFSTNERNIYIFRGKIHLHICEDGCNADFWTIFHWLSKVATAEEFYMADLKFSALSCSIRHWSVWHASHVNPRSGTHRSSSSRFIIGDLWRHETKGNLAFSLLTWEIKTPFFVRDIIQVAKIVCYKIAWVSYLIFHRIGSPFVMRNLHGAVPFPPIRIQNLFFIE